MEVRQCPLEGMVMNPEFWRGKRVFLTGHTGFKGSWLSLWLQDLGAELTGFALDPPTHPNLFEEAHVAKGMHSIVGNILDLPTLQSALQNANPEIVIHMAAQSLVRHSYLYPVETYETNVMGTVNLLEAVRHTASVRAVLNVTSDKCYDNHELTFSYREEDAMGGFDPYSSSKGCSELVTAAYRSSFFSPNTYLQHGVAVASSRAGNVIGGGDWARDRLIPDIVTSFSEKRTVIIRNPHAIRPWQHVLEPLSGYLCLVEHLFQEGPKVAEAWNFGPADKDTHSVNWIVQRMAELWGPSATWKIDAGDHPHEASHLALNSTKAQNRLGWRPRWTLDKTLRTIIFWHKSHATNANMQAIALEQIRDFTMMQPTHQFTN